MDTSEALIYLCGCVVNGTIPDKTRLEGVDMAGLHAEASRHMVAAIAGYALESAGINHELFTQSRAKALRKAVILDSDCRGISAGLENAGIWHMPLKGIVMKDYYPAFGLREMSDVDILFDSSRIDDTRKIVRGMGYSFSPESYSSPDHDVYFRKPVSNIEMHRVLFDDYYAPALGKYYADVRTRLHVCEGKKYTLRFSPEDFYVYITAHAYRHYNKDGTGLRTVLDEYLMLRKFSGSLDWDYVSREAGKMNIAMFEEDLRTLALALFGGGEFTERSRAMLRYIIFSGVYGLSEMGARNEVITLHGGSRVKYVLAQIFPPLDKVSPFFRKHKLLYPFVVVYRLLKAATVSRKKVLARLRGIMREVK